MELSIVLPVKGNEHTIRAAVESLLAQDLTDPYEVIVVVDRDTGELDALGDLSADPRLRLVEPEPFPIPGARDSNWRRCVGVAAARGRCLAFVDADMVFPPDWARRGLALLDGADCAAGSVRSAEGLGFWGGYVDRNNLGAKTPRFASRTLLTRETLGGRGRKPPITANLFCRKSVVEAVGSPRPDVTFNYDDYAFCQDIVDAGYTIVCDPSLVGHHRHRHSWRDLVNEYARSGRGCGQYVRCYPNAQLARRRKVHVVFTCTALVAIALGVLVAPVATLFALFIGFAALSVAQWATVRAAHAAVYPAVTCVLGLAFVGGFLLERTTGRPVSVAWPPEVASLSARPTIDLVQIEREACTRPRSSVVPRLTIAPAQIQAEVIAGEL